MQRQVTADRANQATANAGAVPCDSQADSGGSIPLTRSTKNAKVNGRDADLCLFVLDIYLGRRWLGWHTPATMRGQVPVVMVREGVVAGGARAS